MSKNFKDKSFGGGTAVFGMELLIFIVAILLLISETYHFINSGDSPTGIILALILIGFLLVEAGRVIQGKRRLNLTSRTLNLLGDAYYAIYKINLKKGTYDCIKTTPEERKILGDNGSYEFLIETLKKISLLDDADDYIKRFQQNRIDRKHNGPFLCYSGEFKRKIDGEYKWVNVRIIQDGGTAPCEALWCFKLVDEEKKSELEHGLAIKDTIESKEKRFKKKTEFFSQASHDMRTPLNAIIGFANLSKNQNQDMNCMMDYMGKIEKSANHLLVLINDVLEYSKFGEDINKLNIEPFNIEETVDEMELLFEDRLDIFDKSIVKNINIVHENVMGDRFKLNQVMKNLLTNSIKYSNNGAVINITLNEVTCDKHAKYQLIVEDNGIGMSKEFLKHIYEPYAREVQLLSKRETIGTGLGMVIVKNIVNMMNGEINVESQLGVGTKVTVTLPFEIADEEIEQKDNEKIVQEEVSLAEENKFFKNMNILVAEDNELNMEILAELLKMRGVSVTKAWNGQEAVDAFVESEVGFFDCILMDMNMPVMDGCEATRKIRATERLDSGNVPIFAVTANAYAEDIDKTTAAGMDGHVPKPLDFDLLYKMVRMYIETHHVEKEKYKMAK